MQLMCGGPRLADIERGLIAMATKKRKDRADSREKWIELAREAFIKDGAAAISINEIAKKLDVTRGSFYWWFKSLADLQTALIKDWQKRNNEPYLAALSGDDRPIKRFWRLVFLWAGQGAYNPDYDTAMRSWAHSTPKIAKAVRDVDDTRISALTQLFRDAGQDEAQAVVRARIVYFSQVGYYALGVRYPARDRVEYTETSIKIMTGFDDIAVDD